MARRRTTRRNRSVAKVEWLPADRTNRAPHDPITNERHTMITGSHVIIYSTNPDADRVFLRDVLKLTYLDVGDGWLIFGLPRAEVAVHPAEKSAHELYLMCDDISRFVADMQRHSIACDPVSEQAWGLLTRLALPGGSKLGVHEPRHSHPRAIKRATASRTQRAGVRKKRSGRR